MPINEKMMKNFKKQYGNKLGEKYYYMKENKDKKKKRYSITESAMRK